MEVKPPMDYKTFAKNPIVAMLFIVILGIVYVYTDMKGTFRQYTTSQDKRITMLEYRDSVKTEHIRHCDSSVASLNTKVQYLEQKGGIAILKPEEMNKVAFISAYK
jgi:hypothetical protein